MSEPRRLTTLWAFSGCYRDSFTFFTFFFNLFHYASMVQVWPLLRPLEKSSQHWLLLRILKFLNMKINCHTGLEATLYRFVFESSSVRISSGSVAILRFSCFSSVPLHKCRGNTSFWPQEFPSKSFSIHNSSVILLSDATQFDSVSVVMYSRTKIINSSDNHYYTRQERKLFIQRGQTRWAIRCR
jgi:hypothetical protein